MKKNNTEEPNVTLFGGPVTKKQKDSGDIITGLIIMTSGVILLGNNLGIISWDFWQAIRNFWPFIIVLMGIHLILGNSILAKIGILIITITVLGLVVIMGLHSIEWAYLPTLPPAFIQILEFIEGRI